MLIEIYAVRPGCIKPSRANPSDAGLDLYFNPVSSLETMTIAPGESKLFATGFKFGVPHGYMMEIKNRSSIAAKRNLIVGACVVDPGYDGEVFVNLHNIGHQTEMIGRGDKIAQAVFIPVAHVRVIEALDDTLYDEQIAMSNRGSGALGSTDKK